MNIWGGESTNCFVTTPLVEDCNRLSHDCCSPVFFQLPNSFIFISHKESDSLGLTFITISFRFNVDEKNLTDPM